MLISIARIALLSLTLLDAKVTTLDGRTSAGSLQQITSENITLKTSGGEGVAIAAGDVIDVLVASPDAQMPDPLQIILHDESQLAVSDITATADTVTAVSAILGDLKLSRSLVRAIQLKEIGPETAGEWRTFQERTNDRDLLIVGKRDGDGLDFLAGEVTGVTAEAVPFLLSGDEIPVPRSRVFGVILPTEKTAGRKPFGVTVSLNDGSVLKASALEFQGDSCRLKTSWGGEISIGGDRLRRVDFSSSRVHYLSDLEPLAERYFGMDPPGQEWGNLFDRDVATRTGLSSQWRMSRDRFPNNGRPPLMLRGQVYRKGLCIFPKAQVDYAVDSRYSRLTAVVGVDDEVAGHQRLGQTPTAVELVIQTDGNEAFRQLISAPADPITLDVDLTGITTLSILVDFGDDSSTCDYLDIADARLIVDPAAQ
ncbi:MAG: NPCBM/NEW2 domain-containing protein [Planctomycetaceae bacterium]